jgi:hypothetical protein
MKWKPLYRAPPHGIGAASAPAAKRIKTHALERGTTAYFAAGRLADSAASTRLRALSLSRITVM